MEPDESIPLVPILCNARPLSSIVFQDDVYKPILLYTNAESGPLINIFIPEGNSPLWLESTNGGLPEVRSDMYAVVSMPGSNSAMTEVT